MKTLFESATVVEIMERLSVLRPESERVWGKMNAAQALAHCSAVMEMAVGDAYPPRLLVGRLLGPLLKPIYSNEKPLKRGSPTDKSFIVRGQRDFAIEKERLSNLFSGFSRVVQRVARSIRIASSVGSRLPNGPLGCTNTSIIICSSLAHRRAGVSAGNPSGP
jgi:hypothetical protein